MKFVYIDRYWYIWYSWRFQANMQHCSDVIMSVVASHHQRLGCLLSDLFRRRSKKASKFRVTGLFEGNSPATGEFPAQRASNAENVSIWWRHHGKRIFLSSVAGCQLKPHDQDLWQPKHNTNINQALFQCFCLVWLQTNESSKIFYTPFCENVHNICNLHRMIYEQCCHKCHRLYWKVNAGLSKSPAVLNQTPLIHTCI